MGLLVFNVKCEILVPMLRAKSGQYDYDYSKSRKKTQALLIGLSGF